MDFDPDSNLEIKMLEVNQINTLLIPMMGMCTNAARLTVPLHI